MRKKFLITSIIVLIVFILSHTSAFASRLVGEMDCGEYKVAFYEEDNNRVGEIYTFNKNVRTNEGYLIFDFYSVIDSKTIKANYYGVPFSQASGYTNFQTGVRSEYNDGQLSGGGTNIVVEDGNMVWLTEGILIIKENESKVLAFYNMDSWSNVRVEDESIASFSTEYDNARQNTVGYIYPKKVGKTCLLADYKTSGGVKQRKWYLEVEESYVVNNFNDKTIFKRISNIITSYADPEKYDKNARVLRKKYIDSINYLNLKNEFQKYDGIDNLDGIETFINLRSLDITANKVKSLEPLTKLQNLNELYISNAGLKNINDMKDLKSLRVLNISDNQIVDVESLSELPISELYGKCNEIKDVTPLAKISSLSILDLSGNPISNINALKDNKSLKELYLNDCHIEDIGAISQLSSLKTLSIQNNTIYKELKDGKTIELPNIFIDAQKDGSLVYTSQALKCENCHIDGNMIIVDNENKNAKVQIVGGNANGTVLEIKGVPYENLRFNNVNLYNAVKKEIQKSFSSDLYEFDDSNNIIKIGKASIDKITRLDISATTESQAITDITGLEQFTNLKTLIARDNKIENIDKLKDLKNLKHLDISNNKLNDISKLKELNKLVTLIAKDNNIESLDGISSLRNLEYVDFSDNKITDVSELSKLNLDSIIMTRNKVKDISMLAKNYEYKILDFDSNNVENIGEIKGDMVWLTNNEINIAKVNETEFELPQIITKVTDENSWYYAEKGITCTGCEIKDGKIVLNEGVTQGTIRINSDAANKTVIKVEKAKDKTSPVVRRTDIKSDEGTVRVQLYSDEPIKASSDWKYTNQSKKTIEKTFECSADETINVYDMSGNKTQQDVVVRIDQDKEKIKGLKVSYDTSAQTNDTVKIKITADEELYLPNFTDLGGGSAQLSEDKKQITITVSNESNLFAGIDIISLATYNSNVELTNKHNEGLLTDEEYSELAGENDLKKVRITYGVNNIDKKAPVCNVSYDVKDLVSGNVEATITSDEIISKIEKVGSEDTNNEWYIEENDEKYTAKRLYIQNTKEQYYVYDVAGNRTLVEIDINNIDKQLDNPVYQYNKITPTNDEIKLTIDANENISDNTSKLIANSKDYVIAALSGENPVRLANTASLDSGIIRLAANETNGVATTGSGKQVVKTYSQSTNETVMLEDNAGNRSFIPVDIDIDKQAPVVEAPKYITNSDGTVTVEITANEELDELEDWKGWQLSEDKKTFTKTFNSNVYETFEIKDLAGNTTNVEVNVDTINPGLIILDVTCEEIKDNENEEESEDYYESGLYKLQGTGKYKVTIKASNELKEVSGWTTLIDGKSIAKRFDENAKETVTVEDIYGNKNEIKIDIAKLLNGGKADITEIDTGKKPDESQSNTPIPNAGKTIIIAAVTALGGFVMIRNRKKLKKMRNIR